MDSSGVETCPRLLADLWGSDFSLCSPSERERGGVLMGFICQTGKISSLLKLYFFSTLMECNVQDVQTLNRILSLLDWHFYWDVTFELPDSISLRKTLKLQQRQLLKSTRCNCFGSSAHINKMCCLCFTYLINNTHSYSQRENILYYKCFCHMLNMKVKRNSLYLRPVRSCDRGDSSSQWLQVLYFLLPMIEQPFKKVIYLSSQDRRWTRRCMKCSHNDLSS